MGRAEGALRAAQGGAYAPSSSASFRPRRTRRFAPRPIRLGFAEPPSPTGKDEGRVSIPLRGDRKHRRRGGGERDREREVVAPVGERRDVGEICAGENLR